MARRVHRDYQRHHSTLVGSSIGLSAFTLMLIIAAYESRRRMDSVHLR